MTVPAEQGRITVALVEEEITRLRANWQSDAPATALPPEFANIDLFEQRQLEAVLDVCRTANSLYEAGRQLFAVSRQQKQKPNDADRLRKYLARFGLSWEKLKREG
ncbi:hypothetical protein NC16_01940 [Pectobacterium brasiliense]|nr:hypothetical protein NC16_01940 [Pectobacterium brasiliense]